VYFDFHLSVVIKLTLQSGKGLPVVRLKRLFCCRHA